MKNYFIVPDQDGSFTVKEIRGVYPKHSVLAGQDRICFVDSFNDLYDAQKKYPSAELSHALLMPQNTYDHLPDSQDDGYFDNMGN